MMAVGRCRAVCSRRDPGGGENRFTAAGRGDSVLLRELLPVVPHCLNRGGDGVMASKASHSDLPQSLTKVGVFGAGDKLRGDTLMSEGVGHTPCVSGVILSCEVACVGCTFFGRTILSWG